MGLELPQRSGNVGCNPGSSPSLVDDLWSPECFLSAKCETSICLAFPGYGISFQLENLPGQGKRNKEKGHWSFVKNFWTSGSQVFTARTRPRNIRGKQSSKNTLPKASISLYFPSVVHNHLILFWKSQTPSKVRITKQFVKHLEIWWC